MFAFAVLSSLALSNARTHEQARALSETASREYAAADYRDALRDFQTAFTLEPLPAILFNLAQCNRKLGNWQDAVDLYRRYLAASPEAPNRAEVQVRLAEAQAKLEAQTAAAAVATAPAPAPTPAPLTAPPPPAASPSTLVSSPTVSDVAPPAAASGRVLPWVCFGGAAVAGGLAITGAVEVASYLSARNAVNNQGQASQSSLNQPRAQNWGTAALILGPLSVAAAAAGVVLIW